MSLGAAANNQAPTQPVNFQLLKLYIDTIPQFSGNENNTLEIFIEHCESLVHTYTNRDNVRDPLNTFLIRAIISKLTGRALMLVGSRPEIRDWDDLKGLLRLSFGDQRNLDCLVQELIALKPNKNESFVEFGQRIQKVRSSISCKLKSQNLSLAQRQFRMENYDELSLKTFIRGLTGRIQDMVRLRAPDTLELAISYVLEEENFMHNQRQYLGLPSNNNNSNFNRIPAPRPQPQNPQFNHNFSPRFSNPNFQNFPFNNNRPFQQPHFSNFNAQPYQQPYFTNYQPQFKPQFPSQPINIQPRPNLPAPKFFTNEQVFGPPKNVWKPTGQTPQNKPMPMSVSTRNSSLSNRSNFNPQQVHCIETDEAINPSSDNPLSSIENLTPEQSHPNYNFTQDPQESPSTYDNFNCYYEQIPTDFSTDQTENFQSTPTSDNTT